MGLNDVVNVAVSAQQPGVTQAGFGVLLILSQNATFTSRTRTYGSLTAVGADFPAGTPEYAAAAAAFAQSPTISSVRIGRANTNPVTQQWAVALVSAAIAVAVAYKLYLTSPLGVSSEQTASYTVPTPGTWSDNSNAGTAYPRGTIVTNAGRYWVATTGGVGSARTGPSGTGSGIRDGSGGVTWNYVEATGLPSVWSTGMYSLTNLIQQPGGNIWICTTAGTSSGSVPAGLNASSPAPGTQVTDSGGVVWTIVTTWQSDTAYTNSPHTEYVNKNGNVYVLATAGTSDNGPVNTVSSTPADGTVTWLDCGATSGTLNDAIAQNLIYAIQAFSGLPWAPNAPYVLNNFVQGLDGVHYYKCTGAGTSGGSGGPTGTSTSPITGDGSVTWTYVGTSQGAAPIPAVTCALSGSSIGSKSVTVSANSTSVWVGVEIDDPNLMLGSQTHAASTGTSADLDAISNETTDWYGIISLYNSPAYIEAVAGWAEGVAGTTPKLYVADSADTVCATTAYAGGTDVGSVLRGHAYQRTAPFFHPRAAEFAAAAEIGRFFPIDPGGDNWRLKTLKGVSSGWGNGQQYTSNQIANLKGTQGGDPAKAMNFYYNLAGVDVIGGSGLVSFNEYIDVVRGIDWWQANVQERLADLLIQNEKIPFTDAGIRLVADQVKGANQDGVDAGLINPGSPPTIPSPSVTVPKAGAVSSADRAARQLLGVNSSWYLAGAINFIKVNAQVLT